VLERGGAWILGAGRGGVPLRGRGDRRGPRGRGRDPAGSPFVPVPRGVVPADVLPTCRSNPGAGWLFVPEGRNTSTKFLETRSV